MIDNVLARQPNALKRFSVGAVALCEVGVSEIINFGWSDREGQLEAARTRRFTTFSAPSS